MPDLQERVELELRLRGLSIRGAADVASQKAGERVISNQTLGNFLAGGPVTDKVRRGLALALDWEMDWPENPPTPTLSDEIHVQLTRLEERFSALEGRVETLESASGRPSGPPDPPDT